MLQYTHNFGCEEIIRTLIVQFHIMDVMKNLKCKSLKREIKTKVIKKLYSNEF